MRISNLSDAIDRPGWLDALPPQADISTFPPLGLNASWAGLARCTSPAYRTDCEGSDAARLLFYGRTNGISLELGGLDGVLMSETLVLEQRLGWRRVIIEASPRYRARRQQAAPEVVGVTAAICSSPGVVHHVGTSGASGILEYMPTTYLEKYFPHALAAFRRANHSWAAVDFSKLASIPVRCAPLTSVLDAIGVQWVHFFILDTEGSELNILHTVDWDRVHFGVLCIEVTSPTGSRPAEYRNHVLEFMLRRTGGKYRALFDGWPRERNLWFMHTSFEARGVFAGDRKHPMAFSWRASA